MTKRLFYVKPATTAICAAGGSLLAASGITGSGDDFPWEQGAKENDNTWQVAPRRDLSITFEDDTNDGTTW